MGVNDLSIDDEENLYRELQGWSNRRYLIVVTIHCQVIRVMIIFPVGKATTPTYSAQDSAMT